MTRHYSKSKRGKNNKIELQNSCLNGCRQKLDSTRQQAVDATQLAVQAQSVAQFASTTVSAYETKLGEIQHTVDQLQQLVINERKNRMKMESQLSAAQDKIGAAERHTQLLEQKNENLQKELDSWNEDTTPEFTSNLQSVASGSELHSFGMSCISTLCCNVITCIHASDWWTPSDSYSHEWSHIGPHTIWGSTRQSSCIVWFRI